jgi:hypothetical protein
VRAVDERPLGRAARVVAALAALGVLVVLRVPLCPFALVTHRPCPGCGLGRATLALCAGDFAGAFAAHPLAPILSPLAALALALNAVAYVRRGRGVAVETLRGPAVTVGAGLLIAAGLGVWIARFFGLLGGPAPV